jgi:hypothetical protein
MATEMSDMVPEPPAPLAEKRPFSELPKIARCGQKTSAGRALRVDVKP